MNKLYCNESFLLDTAILLVLLMTICSFSLSAYNLSKSLFNLFKRPESDSDNESNLLVKFSLSVNKIVFCLSTSVSLSF